MSNEPHNEGHEPDDADERELERQYIAGKGRVSKRWLARELDRILEGEKLRNTIVRIAEREHGERWKSAGI